MPAMTNNLDGFLGFTLVMNPEPCWQIRGDASVICY